MPDSIASHLESDLGCESLLDCVHGVGELDREVYLLLADTASAWSVDDVADEVDRERSTVHRSFERLRDADLVSRQKVDYSDGGYRHLYTATSPEDVAAEFDSLIDDWTEKMKELVEEFRREYAGRGRHSDDGARDLRDDAVQRGVAEKGD